MKLRAIPPGEAEDSDKLEVPFPQTLSVDIDAEAVHFQSVRAPARKVVIERVGVGDVAVRVDVPSEIGGLPLLAVFSYLGEFRCGEFLTSLSASLRSLNRRSTVSYKIHYIDFF